MFGPNVNSEYSAYERSRVYPKFTPIERLGVRISPHPSFSGRIASVKLWWLLCPLLIVSPFVIIPIPAAALP